MMESESLPKKAEKATGPSTLRNETPVILHVDVDAFECQVYSRYNPQFKKIPLVVAHNTGRIVSVNYPARKYGISRALRIDEAKKLVKNLKVITIPYNQTWGKSVNTIARHASQELLDFGVLPYQKLNPEIVVNFASSDEFFIDITELVTKRMKINTLPLFSRLSNNTYLEGTTRSLSRRKLKERLDRYSYNNSNKVPEHYLNEIRLIFGGIIAAELSDQIWHGVKFGVSCGVGNNILLAKLATSLHKPRGITILPPEGIDRISRTIKIGSIPGLGGKRGQHLQQELDVETMWDLQHVPVNAIRNCFEGTEDMGTEQSILAFSEKVVEWSFGVDTDEVIGKLYKERINCGKAIPYGFTTFEKFCRQVTYLIEEMMQRVGEEKIRVKSIVRLPVSFKLEIEFYDSETKKLSRSGHTFPYHDLGVGEILEMAIDRLWSDSESSGTETFNIKNIRRVTFIATKLEAMTEAEHAKLDHEENSTCRIYQQKKLRKLRLKRIALKKLQSKIKNSEHPSALLVCCESGPIFCN